MNKYLLPGGFALMVILSLGACDDPDGPAERAGERVDEAMEQTHDAFEDAGDEARDAMEEAGDEIEDATD